jgi:hypothetical protein
VADGVPGMGRFAQTTSLPSPGTELARHGWAGQGRRGMGLALSQGKASHLAMEKLHITLVDLSVMSNTTKMAKNVD